MSKKIGRIGLLMLGLFLALAMACAPRATAPTPGEGKEAPAGEKAAEGTPKRGGVITISAGASSWHTNEPAFGQTAYSSWVFFGLPMIYRDPETMELKPSVIESWEYSGDGKELTLKLQKGIKFHNKPPINGREVEAKDVVYSIKGCSGKLYPNLPVQRFPVASMLAAFEDAQAVDKYTVKVKLSNPSVSFLTGLSFYRCTWILPDGIREHFGAVESLWDPNYGHERYISAGPFQVKKIQNLVEAVFDRNPNYYEAGKPYLDQVRMPWLSDRSTELAATIAGQLHIRTTAELNDVEFVAKARPDIIVKVYTSRSCWNRLSFNTTRKPFNDVKVRRAIAMVIDQKKIGENVYGSWKGQQIWRYQPPIPFVFPEALSQEELAKLPLYQGPTPENVAEAQRLLKEAGYEKGFAFGMMLSSTRVSDQVLIMQADIEKYLPGVKVKIEPQDAAVNFKRAIDGDYDVQAYCHIFSATAASQLREAFHSSEGSRNYGRFNDPKMDELIDKAEQELDPAKYKQIIREAQLYVLDTLAMFPDYGNMSIAVYQPYIRGFRPGGGNHESITVKDVWFDK